MWIRGKRAPMTTSMRGLSNGDSQSGRRGGHVARPRASARAMPARITATGGTTTGAATVVIDDWRARLNRWTSGSKCAEAAGGGLACRRACSHQVRCSASAGSRMTWTANMTLAARTRPCPRRATARQIGDCDSAYADRECSDRAALMLCREAV